MHEAATDARSFVQGMAVEDFLKDRRTQQAVVMSLLILGEATTKGKLPATDALLNTSGL
uniref:HepT-like ribonuclease domain-containing protein n=1 Tax=Komagataeibacter oboediens TaxID=65958 RepID=UPI000237EADA